MVIKRRGLLVSKAKKGGGGHLMTPPTMKDLASCFSEHAVRVSDTSCSGSSSGGSSSLAVAVAETAGAASYSSALAAATSLYRTLLSTSKELIIRVTWSKSAGGGPWLSVTIDDIECQIPKKKKGSRSFVSGGGATVAVHWDYSSARYGGGAAMLEPAEEFYVVVVVDEEYALLLGDSMKRFEEAAAAAAALPMAESVMIGRREQAVSGGGEGGALQWTTRARFCGGGAEHEITVRCTGGGGWEAKDAELWVAVDKKRVVNVRRLRWNFRGNQTVFIDGLPVDLMWDVHGWLSSAAAAGGDRRGQAVFLFRTRSALESRLWLEEEKLHKERRVAGGFCLLIQATNTGA